MPKTLGTFELMQVHHGIATLPKFRNSVVTIGSYDGVHTGHQHVISQCISMARKVDGESILITFDPHPRQFLRPSSKDIQPIQMLSSLPEKVEILEESGLDHLVIVSFDARFAAQSPQEYLDDFLYRHFEPAAIVVGFDHRFGKDRAGNLDQIKEWSAQRNIHLEVISKKTIDDLKTSSTRIRNLLSSGKVNKANQLLDRPYRLLGTIIRGNQIGRTIGFPTANMELKNKSKIIPAFGIYVTRCIIEGRSYRSMSYIGRRPAISEDDGVRIEVNILDFDQDIYEKEVTLEFLRRIRDDEGFENLDHLAEALQKDELSTRAYFDKKTALVILNYNGIAHLKSYLPSILSAVDEKDELIILDNGSTDDSVSWLKSQHPEVKLLELGENYGFAGGYTRGLEDIEADYFVLINSDLQFDNDWYNDIVIQMARDPNIAAAQPKILSMLEPQKFEYAGAAGGLLDRWYYPFGYGRIFDHTEVDSGQYEDSREVFWASGAAMVIKADLFRSFGGFDSRFFAHQEEIDLCWRLKRAGYKIMSYPQQEIYHLGGGTLAYGSPFKTFLNFRNSLYMILNNAPSPVIPKVLWRGILDGVAFFKFVAEGHLKDAWSIVRAHGSIWKTLRDAFRHRKKYAQMIDEKSIGPANLLGMSSKSVIVEYFLRKKKTTHEILQDQ